MIETGAVKKGMTIELDGSLYKILILKHIKIARG